MKGKWKKRAALALAGLMMLLNTASVMAAEEDVVDPNRPVSLTICKYDQTAAEEKGVGLSSFTAVGETDAEAEAALSDYALQGVVFTILRAADLNTESRSGSVRLTYDLPEELGEILHLTAESHTSDEINEALQAALTSENTALKNALEQYVLKNEGFRLPETDENGRTKAEDLAQGLYLVVETEVPEKVSTTTDPFFVSLPMTNAAGDAWMYDPVVYPKNQTNEPTIDKLVAEDGTYADTATASEGDILDYRIVVGLPVITSEATYLSELVIVDTLSEGLSYNRDVSIAFYASEEDAKNGVGTPSFVWQEEEGMFETGYTERTMTIRLTEKGLAAVNPAGSGLCMTAVYTASVHSDESVLLGDDGSRNKAELTYGRSNGNYIRTIEDEARVYSYGIHLTKTFDSEGGDASEVSFVLKNTTDGYWVTADGAEGVYYVTGEADAESDATAFSPSSDGSLVINGLEADAYSLTETATSDGFSLLEEPVVFVLESTAETILPSRAGSTGSENEYEEVTVTKESGATAVVDGETASMSSDGDSDNARVEIGIRNTSSFILPRTGGFGTLFFTLGGTLAAVLGMGWIRGARKKRGTEAD